MSGFKYHVGACRHALAQPFVPKRTPCTLKRSSYTWDLRHPDSHSHFCVVSDNTGSYHIKHKLMSATQTEGYIINKQACLHQTPPASIVAPSWPAAAFCASVARRKDGSSPGHDRRDGRFCYWQTGVAFRFDHILSLIWRQSFSRLPWHHCEAACNKTVCVFRCITSSLCSSVELQWKVRGNFVLERF